MSAREPCIFPEAGKRDDGGRSDSVMSGGLVNRIDNAAHLDAEPSYA